MQNAKPTLLLSSSAFETVRKYMQPIMQYVPADAMYDTIKSLELVLMQVADLPEWLSAQDADLYCRARWKMPFTGKDRPPYKPIGQVNYCRREDIDAWARSRIEARPTVQRMR